MASISLPEQTLGGNYYQAYYDFFKKVFLSQKDYIAFVARRCSCMAYIFYNMLVENNEIDEMNSVIMTDASIQSFGEMIGRKLYEGETDLPTLVIVDDSASYGRAMASVLDDLTGNIYSGIYKLSREKNENIGAAINLADMYLKKYVSVNIYAKKNQPSIIAPYYRDIIKYDVEISPNTWNEISNRITECLIHSNVVNASFVLSAELNEEQKQTIEHSVALSNWYVIEREYQFRTQLTYLKPIYIGERLKAITTLRFIQCDTLNKYHIVPFVFLPSLNEMVLEQLENNIIERLERLVEHSEMCGEILSALKLRLQTWQDETSDFDYSRTRMEFVTLYLSQFLLWSFLKQAEVTDVNAFDKEKIQWNYQCVFSETYTEKIIEFLCDKSNASMLFEEKCESSIENELRSCLSNVEMDFISESYQQDAFFNASYKERIEQINELLEDYLFELAAEAEASAHKHTTIQVKPEFATLEYLKNMRNHTLADMYDGVKNRIRDRQNVYPLLADVSVAELFAAILQMMDVGLMSVVARGKTKVDEVIYEQQIRTCEQAMFSLPRRYHKSLNFFQQMESNGWMVDSNMEQYLRVYFDLLEEEKLVNENNKEEQIYQWIFFLKNLKKAKQRVSYWNIRLKRQFKLNGDGTKLICVEE